MSKYLPWMGAGLIIVITFGTMYTVTQQSQRLDANYPQVQIAEDTAARLDSGTDPSKLSGTKVDMSHSLAPFMIIYDKSGHVVSGTGYLGNAIPTIPYGVLTGAKGQPFNSVTWQPASEVRLASVTIAAHNYYVVSGRSLSEVENNETTSLQLSVIGCLAALLVLFATFLIMQPSPKKR